MKAFSMTMNPLNLSQTRLLVLGAALLSIAACSTVQPNSRIADAQGRLSAAYNDKETGDRGQGALANAKEALMSAEADWQKGDKEKSEHNLMLGNTYLDIAQTRGQQAKLEKENVRLANQARLTQKDQQLAAQGQMIADQSNQLYGKNQQINARDDVISGKNSQLAEQDQQLAEAQAQLKDYNMKLTNLGSTMVLQDVSFETGKSQLLPGGLNRLTPLINYLRLSPKTQVRIDGYTDSVGGVAYNQQLSLDRANAVKSILMDAGVAGDRISTTGSGLTKPVATNSTVAGRQANRRVEITLLKQPAP